MSEEVIKILDDLCKRFGIAIDWSSENIVPYLEQLCKKYINYEIVTSVIWIILFATGFIIICNMYFHGYYGVRMCESRAGLRDWRG